MAYQKLQSREALLVIPDNTVRIPDPNTAINLISTTVAANRWSNIICSRCKFGFCFNRN